MTTQELNMVQRRSPHRSEHEQRIKAQRDERARMQYAVEQAWLEGRAEGIAEAIAESKAKGKAEGQALGAVKGRIQLLSELLNTEQVPVDALSMEQLVAIENDLQRQFRDQGV